MITTPSVCVVVVTAQPEKWREKFNEQVKDLLVNYSRVDPLVHPVD